MREFNKRLQASTVAFAACGALMAGFGAMSAANAGIADLFATDIFGVTEWEDTSVEAHIDTNSNGRLDVGDRLRGILRVDTITGDPAPNDLQLTAIFDTTVMSAVDDSPSGAPDSEFDYTFGPTAGFAGEVGGPAGSMVAFFTDASFDFDRDAPGCTTLMMCEGNVTDGTLQLILGHGVEATDGWIAENASPFPSAATGASLGTTLGTFYINFSELVNNLGDFTGGIDCFSLAHEVHEDQGGAAGNDGVSLQTFNASIPGTCDVVASGDVKGSLGLDSSPYPVTDDVRFFFRTATTIPEPGMLGLFGLGLLGLGAMARRQGKKA